MERRTSPEPLLWKEGRERVSTTCPPPSKGGARGRFFALITLLCLLFVALPARATTWKFDFGAGATEAGYTAVGTGAYNTTSGYGWASGTSVIALRDRTTPDALRRDFVYGTGTAVFRVNLSPGIYKMTLVMGDQQFGNHDLTPAVDVAGVTLPELTAGVGEYATLTVSFQVTKSTLDLTCSSPVNNWVVNALTLEPDTATAPPVVTKDLVGAWGDVASWPDPIAPYVARFRDQMAVAPPVHPTGLSRADYLKVIAGEVDFWKSHQDANGAIIDPYANREWQYSTPAFACAAAALVAYAGRTDLLEPAAKATDWAVYTLSTHQAADHHEDFFAPMLAHTIPLLKPLVDPARAATWESQIRGFNPFTTYSASVGGGNWNVVALSGEWLFHTIGLRDDLSFEEQSLAAQGASFRSPYGLYLEGPMPYDHFPRLWAADMVAHGYNGKYQYNLSEVLRRASLTSLFMQSPTGELPAGGRSAHHQWNEAEQCVTYETYAAKAHADGDDALAAVFKRAAHLALGSMRRWIRPSGEMWIVKNYYDPSLRFGYEGYSAHSQYNLLPMAMLVIAYEHAAATEDIAEKPAPADLGGYVLQIDSALHKVFANAGGMYVEIDTNADPHYNATGLLRVHRSGFLPQLGPSDALTATPSYQVPSGSLKTTAAIGAAWKDSAGTWHRFAEFAPASVTLSNVSELPGKVTFTLTYTGSFSGPTSVVESYVVTPNWVELTTQLNGYSGPMEYVWPVLSDNGRAKSLITSSGGTVTAVLKGESETFRPMGAASVRVDPTLYAGRNGTLRLGIADYTAAAPVTLHIEPKALAFGWGDVSRALEVASGYAGAAAADEARLDMVWDGASAGRVDMADVLHLARITAGLDPNP